MDEGRYRRAEQALFAAAGIRPREHWLALWNWRTRTRVLEVGQGTPTLFLTGGPNCAATWAYVAAATHGLRCLLLDRPGTGLSERPPQVPDADHLDDYAAGLVVAVLDALGLESAPLVASSFGGFVALRSAIARPARIGRVVLAGCPAFVPGWRAPRLFTWLRTPLLGWALLAAPATAGAVRQALQQLGHGESLRRQTIPPPMLEWMRAWRRDTPTMGNDAEMIRRCGTRRGGFAEHLDLTPEELRRVRSPCRIVIGTADPVGGAEVARNVASLLPEADVVPLEGAGHLPWLDDPGRMARAASDFIAAAGGSSPSRTPPA